MHQWFRQIRSSSICSIWQNKGNVECSIWSGWSTENVAFHFVLSVNEDFWKMWVIMLKNVPITKLHHLIYHELSKRRWKHWTLMDVGYSINILCHILDCTFEFFLNVCFWIHLIQWIVTKSKSGIVSRDVLCLAIDIFADEVGKRNFYYYI